MKQASLVMSQVDFFIKYLSSELKQLNLLENKNGNDQKSDTNGRFQSNQNVVRALYQSFGNVQQNVSNPQQLLQGYQNFQQGNQQANQ